ncbi:MAG: ATP-binding protein [Planctomycetota bacterium]
MIIAVASGKGGTGKTTLSVNMAAALAVPNGAGESVWLLDCDVEAPNDHLFLAPDFEHEEPVTVLKPEWDPALCTGCGRCAEACLYNALAVVNRKVILFPELCHACGACTFVCPEGAFSEVPAPIGTVQSGRVAEGFRFAHGLLNVGEALAPEVVEAVLGRARPGQTTIVDAAPGTGCPVVAALRGADVAVLVTEPTPFGLNDLKLAVRLSLDLGLPTGVVVNRSDGEDALIQEYLDRVGVPLIGRIPFRRDYAETYSRGELLVERHPELKERLLSIHERAVKTAAGPVPATPEEEPMSAAPGDTPAGVTGRGTGTTRELIVISGKGGTGKTTVTSSLAALLGEQVLADCDVNAADLHLLLEPRLVEAEDFLGGREATIDPETCVACGECAEACHFDAMGAAPDGGSYRVDELACEGCGLCGLVCPVDAVEVSRARTGSTFLSATPYGPLAHARLDVGAENSGRLVTGVRERAADLAAERGGDRIIGDGPPGTSCPVIASVTGADLALVVTEPTVAGVHDLKLALELTDHFGVPALVCINKCDLNPEQAELIRRMVEGTGAEVVGEVPFDEEVNRALHAGEILAATREGPAARAMRRLAEALQERLAPAGA